jgi:hypothetical protein
MFLFCCEKRLLISSLVRPSVCPSETTLLPSDKCWRKLSCLTSLKFADKLQFAMISDKCIRNTTSRLMCMHDKFGYYCCHCFGVTTVTNFTSRPVVCVVMPTHHKCPFLLTLSNLLQFLFYIATLHVQSE